MDHVPPAPYRQNGTVYDAIGNPTSYYNGGAYTFSWSEGRKLTSGMKGNTSFGYTYNADGLRTRKPSTAWITTITGTVRGSKR